MESDAAAIRRSRDQPEAFVTVYERHHAAVHNYLRRRLGVDAADDLAAETFVRAFRVRARYRPQSETARPWLLGIAANLIGDRRRSEARALRAMLRVAAEPAGAGHAAGECVDPDLIEGLRRLSHRDREALLLYAWGELSYAEIAEALGVPVGTVRSRIHHARSCLAAHARPASPSTVGEAHA
jgi:RNA polymerase sigma factor (sigma-70 family)